jgi:hypothetical protein
MKIRRSGSFRRPPDGLHGSKSERRRRPEGLYFWVQLFAALLVIGGVAFGVVISIVHWTDHALNDSSGSLRLVLAVPQNKSAEWGPTGFLQSRSTTPQVDLTVRNDGGKQVLLTRARITVEDSAWLPMCIIPGAGALPISGRYAVTLPFLPRAGETSIDQPLHDEVSPGRADRLKIYFQAPQVGEEDTLYALHVELLTDESGETIDAGRFLLAAPGAVIRNGDSLPENDYLLHGGGFGSNLSDSAWCYRRNLAELNRVMARPGRRTPETASLASLQTAPGWPAFSDHGLPAREAVEPLLKDQNTFGPVVAVYAAEQAHDPQLVEEIRNRASAILLERAERSLVEDWAMNAVEQAHASIWLAPSPAAREVLARAESQQWEVEEEQEELALQQ